MCRERKGERENHYPNSIFCSHNAGVNQFGLESKQLLFSIQLYFHSNVPCTSLCVCVSLDMGLPLGQSTV